jgi:hypothetical protein
VKGGDQPAVAAGGRHVSMKAAIRSLAMRASSVPND